MLAAHPQPRKKKSKARLCGMMLFSSARERRMWIWALAVIAVIFGSLGFAGKLAARLQEFGLVESVSIILFLAGMILVAATVISQGLATRPSGLTIVIAFGVVAVFVLLFLRTAVLVERTHLIEYGVLGTFVYAALAERLSPRRPVRTAWLLALTITTAIGTLDEAVQFVIPDRVFDPVDILFNFLAGSVAITGCVGLGWADRRFTRN